MFGIVHKLIHSVESFVKRDAIKKLSLQERGNKKGHRVEIAYKGGHPAM